MRIVLFRPGIGIVALETPTDRHPWRKLIARKQADRTKALLDMFAIVAIPCALLLTIVGFAAGAWVGGLAIGSLFLIFAALTVFSIVRRRKGR